MRISRRFQPMLCGLPSRIAPSAMAAVAPVVSAPALTVTASDSDTTETGTFLPIIFTPPTTGNSGTLVC